MRTALDVAPALLLAAPLLVGCHLIVSTDDLTVASVTTDGAKVTMGNDVATLQLDCQGGCFPTELRIRNAGDQNLLYTGRAKNERFLGISCFDLAYSWDNQATDSLDVLEAVGPVGQVLVRWRDGTLAGTSLFTLHPDGRLHRDERLGNQGVSDFTDVHLLAYVALDSALFSSVSWDIGAGRFTDTLKDGDTYFLDAGSTDVGHLCAFNPATGAAVSWSHRSTAPMAVDSGLRLWEVANGQPHAFSLLLATDWVRAGTVPPGTEYTGQFLSVLDSSGDCALASQHSKSFLHPPTLTPSVGSLVTTVDEGDYDHDGYNEAGGFFEVAAENGEIRLTASADLPSFTLRVHGAGRGRPEVDVDGTRLVQGTDFQAGPTADSTAWWLHVGRPLTGELRARWEH